MSLSERVFLLILFLRSVGCSPPKTVELWLPRPFLNDETVDTIEARDTLLDDRCIAHAMQAAGERLVIRIEDTHLHHGRASNSESDYIWCCRTISRLYSTAWECACTEGKQDSVEVLVLLPGLQNDSCQGMSKPSLQPDLTMAMHPTRDSQEDIRFESIAPIVEKYVAALAACGHGRGCKNSSRSAPSGHGIGGGVLFLDDAAQAIGSSSSPGVAADGESRAPFRRVAVGGTFDRLHLGHRKLLTAASLLSTDAVVVGVAASPGRGSTWAAPAVSTHGGALSAENGGTLPLGLRHKSAAQRMKPFSERAAAVSAFLAAAAPARHVEVVELQDAVGPAASDPSLEALLVSSETLDAAAVVHAARDPQLKPLKTAVLRRTQFSSLSSTKLRERLK